MKSFIGLLKKEWVLYRSWFLVGIFMGLMLSWIVPYILHQYVDLFAHEHQLAFAFTMLVLFLGGFYSILQFLASMRLDIKAKESWLHSTSSITKLIGAKLVCSLVGYVLFTILFTSIAIFNIKDELIASAGQILLVLVIIVIILTILQLMLFIVPLFFLAFYLQLKRIIGRFSIVLTMIVFYVTTAGWARVTESQLYRAIFLHGEVSLQNIEHYLPKAKEMTMEWMLGSIYVVEEIAITLLLLLLFLAASKWLERVVLR
ncbi:MULTISPECIES: hypothetical protein [Lysinibacillus]|uniref:hypothetical protein n=1 Tax=Lysinibacillus TaxID=400634 RepID=UPI0021A5FFB2|nr:hypothetical protein [Lysinibacillus capsici]MCT1539011.1 hypothetical protein [Lysinibacillus capsici]MCT1569772.1 hypothetical protein [Lysinibacillus capsici]MCT1647230.1 hypothetical protein [Lysinibacillus capsici]MCT1725771.1 hypothetical protein [Lysinibacillus capsici]MCT1782822.1 hypothetical protein [Lysinibacillus capsici]